MFKFLKAGVEFNNAAKAMNGMNVMLQNLIPKIASSYDHSEFAEEILVLAFVARKGVLDRMEQFNWTMDAKIVVPTIDRGRITLMYAFSQTVGKLQIIAAELGMSDEVENILDKGDTYYALERNLPDHVVRNV